MHLATTVGCRLSLEETSSNQHNDAYTAPERWGCPRRWGSGGLEMTLRASGCARARTSAPACGTRWSACPCARTTGSRWNRNEYINSCLLTTAALALLFYADIF